MSVSCKKKERNWVNNNESIFVKLVQTYTAGTGVVQPKACVTFTHRA